MSDQPRRITGLQAIIKGSKLPAPESLAIVNEFEEVLRVRRVPLLRRRHLLQVLHSTRALDSALEAINAIHGCNPNAKSLGQYLRAFKDHSVSGLGKLSKADVDHYQKSIVDGRNKYMHEAGEFPVDETEIKTILSEMDSCLTQVFAL